MVLWFEINVQHVVPDLWSNDLPTPHAEHLVPMVWSNDLPTSHAEHLVPMVWSNDLPTSTKSPKTQNKQKYDPKNRKEKIKFFVMSLYCKRSEMIDQNEVSNLPRYDHDNYRYDHDNINDTDF